MGGLLQPRRRDRRIQTPQFSTLGSSRKINESVPQCLLFLLRFPVKRCFPPLLLLLLPLPVQKHLHRTSPFAPSASSQETRKGNLEGKNCATYQRIPKDAIATEVRSRPEERDSLEDPCFEGKPSLTVTCHCEMQPKSRPTGQQQSKAKQLQQLSQDSSSSSSSPLSCENFHSTHRMDAFPIHLQSLTRGS